MLLWGFKQIHTTDQQIADDALMRWYIHDLEMDNEAQPWIPRFVRLHLHVHWPSCMDAQG